MSLFVSEEFTVKWIAEAATIRTYYNWVVGAGGLRGFDSSLFYPKLIIINQKKLRNFISKPSIREANRENITIYEENPGNRFSKKLISLSCFSFLLLLLFI